MPSGASPLFCYVLCVMCYVLCVMRIHLSVPAPTDPLRLLVDRSVGRSVGRGRL